MRFTVADVERFKDLLKTSEPTYYECMPPSDQLPSSPHDAFYTLYSIHEFDAFLDALEKRGEHIARYVLTRTGELCFGHEGEPGKTIPEHWHMVGGNPMIIAAGNLFVTSGKITGLSDQSPCATGLVSLFYTLRALHNNHISLAADLELIESVPNQQGDVVSAKNYSITREDLRNMFNHHVNFEHDTGDAFFDEDDCFVDGEREQTTLRDHRSTYERPPSPHPFGRLGFFYNQTTESVSISREPSPNGVLADVPETRTTPKVVQTWLPNQQST